MSYTAYGWMMSVLLASGCSLFRGKTNSGPLPPQLPASLNTTALAPAGREFQELLKADKRASQQINRWLTDNHEAARYDERLRATLASRIVARLTEVREKYIRYVETQPRHAEARLKFGSLLSRLQHDEDALQQWAWATKLNPQLAEAWNNIAAHLATQAQRTGDPADLHRMFDSYDKAILRANAPGNSLYMQNLATALGLFPSAAATHYDTPKSEIPEMALGLLRQAFALAPDNFEIAADLAESHLDIKPLRKADAQAAWVIARRLAHEEHQRQQVDLQLALLEIEDAKPLAARHLLAKITHPALLPLKHKLLHALEQAHPTP